MDLDRINDITLGDRDSQYDQMVGDLVTDYAELIDKLKGLANSHFLNENQSDAFKIAFENLLTEARSKTNEGKRRKYKDLLRGLLKLLRWYEYPLINPMVHRQFNVHTRRGSMFFYSPLVASKRFIRTRVEYNRSLSYSLRV